MKLCSDSAGATAITKTCSVCNSPKNISEFGRQRVENRVYVRPHCKVCDTAKSKAYRCTPAGRASRAREGKRRFQGVLALYHEVKRQQACLICDERDPVCIDFHHLDPSTKSGDVVNMIRASFGRVIEEMAKCVCLCANCHRKFHARRFSLAPWIKPLSVERLEKCAEIARAAVGLEPKRRFL